MNATTRSLLALALYAAFAIACGLGFHFEQLIVSGNLPFFLLGPLLMLPAGPCFHFPPQLALNIFASVLVNGIAAILLFAVARASHWIVRAVCFAMLAVLWIAVGFFFWARSA